MTPTFCCGGECGLIGSLGGSEHWITVSGTAPTISTGTVRSGSRSIRYNLSAQASEARVPADSITITVHRFYVRFATLPSASTYLVWKNAGADRFGLAFQSSDSKLYCAHSDSITVGASGVSVTTGVWYRIDLKLDQSGNTCDARVEGTALGQVTRSGSGSATVTAVGSTATVTGEWFFDDWLTSTTSGDYPLGGGYVNHFVPTSDGTHNIAGTGDFQRGNTGVDILNATTTAYQLVDDVPLPSGTVDQADNQRAVAPPSATDYVEVIYGPAPGISTPTAGPRAVDVLAAYHQVATQNGNIRLALNDNGTTDDYLNLTAAGVTTYRYVRKQYATPPTGGAWTVVSGNGNFNDIRNRFYSADAAPDQCYDAGMIEAEFAETPAGAAAIYPSIALNAVSLPHAVGGMTPPCYKVPDSLTG